MPIITVPTFRRGRERDVERKKKALSLDGVDAPFNTGLKREMEIEVFKTWEE